MYCRVLKVTPQGYAKYLESKTRPYKYARLLADMRAILAEDDFNATYGKKRMYEKLLLDYECPYCYNTVAKIMAENGLLQKKNKPKGLTKEDKAAQKSDNLLNRDFTATAPNQKTVADITAFEASDGKLYVGAIFDCYDNTCLGMALASHMRKELVMEAAINAAGRFDLRGSVSHSDRGSQYTSDDYRKLLESLGIIQSMNTAAGRCHDNAKCESMWARGKCEIMACYDVKKMTCFELEYLIMRYYFDYWNYRRICSAIGGMPPIVKRAAFYERMKDCSA